MKKICTAVIYTFIFVIFCTIVYADDIPETTTEETTKNDIVDFAMDYLDTQYSWGGSTPEEGFDCSGFVNYVYSNFEIGVSRTTKDIAQNGLGITYESAEPGDVIVFSNNGYYSHCGIYIGDGKIIHSYNEEQGVVISEVTDCEYDSINVRRIA